MMAKPQPEFSWDAIRSDCGFISDDCPADAMTIADYGRKYNLTRSTAREQLADMVEAGKLNVGRTLRAVQGGRRTMVKVYWPK